MATSFTREQASANAVAVVKAAVESGAIKLQGPTSHGTIDELATADATYLATLINVLAEQIKAAQYV